MRSLREELIQQFERQKQIEEKVDFLLHKQVERDLEEALQQLEVTPSV